MTPFEKRLFECESVDLLGHLVLPLVGLYYNNFGSGYLKTYLTFSGKIVISASAVNVNFKYAQHPNYVLSFKEYGILYILFDFPKEFEQDMICIVQSKFNELSENAVKTITDKSYLGFNIRTVGGGRYTHPVLAALNKHPEALNLIENNSLDYKGELLPALDFQEDFVDLDTYI